MTTYEIIIVLCGLIIFSYLFEIFAKRTKVPAVLLLLATGIGLRLLADAFDFRSVDFSKLLPLLGTVGLILIVLEGALDLHFTPEKRKVIFKTLGASFFLLLASTLIIGWLFAYITNAPYKICLLNAVPYSIISSAIAIPSVVHLMAANKEFIVYESTFSDIMGIMLFNFLMYNEQVHAGAFLKVPLETVFVLLLAAVFSFFLLYLLRRIEHHVKFFLILAILMLIYAIGKQFHLSTLIIILVFGLFLNNTQLFHFEWFKKLFHYPDFEKDLEQLHLLTAESAFLLRTFFFVIFGFTMDLNQLADQQTLVNGLAIATMIYLLRGLYLRFFAKVELMPLVLISPRGLISILLFFSIPETHRLLNIDRGLLLCVILATNLMITYGLVKAKALPDADTPIEPGTLS